MLWVLKQFFDKVEAFKPKSSRNSSAEIFLVCLGYKAPKHVDPKFLNPKEVFKMLDRDDGSVSAALGKGLNGAVDVMHKKGVKDKRSRGGYAADMPQNMHLRDSAVKFILTSNERATQMLGHYHTLDFSDDGGVVQVFKDGKTIRRQAKSGLGNFIRTHPLTTSNIVACLEDLKVLGKADYKALLKWRHMLRNAIKERKTMKEKKEAQEGDDEKETGEEGGDDGEESDSAGMSSTSSSKPTADELKEMELTLTSTQKRIAQRRKREEKKRRKQHAKLQHRIDQKTAGLGDAVVQEDPLVCVTLL